MVLRSSLLGEETEQELRGRAAAGGGGSAAAACCVA